MREPCGCYRPMARQLFPVAMAPSNQDSTPTAMKRLYALLPVLLLLSIVSTAVAQQRGSFTMTYTEPGSNALRTVRMWVPEEGSLDSMRPLIVAWHGAAQNATQIVEMLVPIARRLGAIIAAPEYEGLDMRSHDIMAD